MIKRLRQLFVTVVLALTPLVAVITPGTAHAAGGGTFTWTGGDASSGNWSVADNWAGDLAPQPNDVGDTIIIDNSQNFSHQSINDVSNLGIANLEFTNNASSGTPTIELDNSIAVTGAITQESSDTNTPDVITNDGAAITIAIGAPTTVTSTAGITFGQPGAVDTIALGGNLTFTDDGGSSANITAIYDNITGSGTVEYDGGATNYQLYGDNTYSGSTQVTATNLPITTSNDNAFGSASSPITVGTGGSISIDYDNTTTLSNPITIAGTTSGSPVTSLDFETLGTGVTISVPNITLNGETRFSNGGTSSTLTVNLAGITSNGYCIQYLGYGGGTTDGPSNGFTNGPTGCVISSGGSGSGSGSTAAPKTPDTGLAAIEANPFVIAAATLLITGALVTISRRLSTAPSGRR